MKVIKVKNYDEMSQVGFENLMNVVKTQATPVLGLATGSTPIGLYKAMIKDHQENQTSYQNVSACNLDEYFGIDPENNQSYAHFMRDNLFNHIDINLENCHIPSGNQTDPEAECVRYNEVLANHPVDVQILGIGGNGHIGFNEPGTALNSQTHVVTLDEQTRLDNARFFGSLEEVPTLAVTMGIRSIMMAKQIILLASGESKAEAVAKMINGDVTTDCPATVLQLHPNVIVIADEAALSKTTL